METLDCGPCCRGVTSVDVSTLAIVDTSDPWYRCQPHSASVSGTRIFCRTSGVSPADIIYHDFDPSGAFVLQKGSPHHGDYPGASRTWVFPDGNRVVDSAGIVYDATTLHYRGSLAG